MAQNQCTTMPTSQKAMLMIMDGWGLGNDLRADAIRAAHTPFVDGLYQQYPHSTLVTCGEAVGLPDGQMGNSEVGHLNLGAGRIVYQELQRINVAIRTGTFMQNAVLNAAIAQAKTNERSLHLIGLVSDGGVHSHINHLKAIISLCAAQKVERVYVHAFTDGRDCDPKSGAGFLAQLQAHMDAENTGMLATVCGRYYAMDRDKRWERVKLAYDALVHAKGRRVNDLPAAVQIGYAEDVTDEFVQPLIAANAPAHAAFIKNDDVVLCFNFRTDRCREITEVLTQQSFPEYEMSPLPLHYVTMTEYDKTFHDVQVIFETDNLNNTLGEVLEAAGKTQIRIAETEKYPHVTFFFSGGREQPFVGETRLMAASPKVATYDLQPEMSAYEIVDKLLPELENEQPDFVCLNFANADMVGHTGVFSAVVKAVETVDRCVEKVVTKALAQGYEILLTADHGNADYMINDDGSPNTQHSLNLVPLFYLKPGGGGQLKPGKLGDVAPTLLRMMGLAAPKEMTGEVLIEG